MKILVTIKEGGYWKPIDITLNGEEVFAICLPDGTIWDKQIGIDDVTRMDLDQFNELTQGGDA